MSEEELDTFSTMQLWEEPPFQSLLPLTEAELPQFQWPSEFQSLPLYHPVWTWDENHILAANVGGNQQPRPQLLPLPELATNAPPLEFAANLGGNQQPQPQLLPLPELATNAPPLEFAANLGGNQQPQPQLPPRPEFPGNVPVVQSAADVCGYQQPQAQPEPVWSEDENKEFEMLIAECR
ncbi:hypothetical protein S83_064431 [Arachis hypogaea]